MALGLTSELSTASAAQQLNRSSSSLQDPAVHDASISAKPLTITNRLDAIHNASRELGAYLSCSYSTSATASASGDAAVREATDEDPRIAVDEDVGEEVGIVGGQPMS